MADKKDTKKDYGAIANRLSKLCRERHANNIDDMATQASVAPGILRGLLRDHRAVGKRTIEKLARSEGVHFDWLWDGTGPMEPDFLKKGKSDKSAKIEVTGGHWHGLVDAVRALSYEDRRLVKELISFRTGMDVGRSTRCSTRSR
jgi:hypothetical protein